MLRNDNLFNIVIDKNKELRNKISKLALKIQGISTIERDAKDKGHWNEDYAKKVLQEFVMEMSFSVEDIEIFIADEIIHLGKLKNTTDHFVDKNTRLPN